MDFFVDTALISEIKEAKDLGIIDGVTTNPSLMAKAGGLMSLEAQEARERGAGGLMSLEAQEGKGLSSTHQIISEIASIIDGPISAEVIATDFTGMIKEGEELSKIHKNIVIKLPMTQDGIKACAYFSEKDIMTNVTLVFSANQALLAAKAGATYVSPFIGRLDDIGQDGLHLIQEIRQMFDRYSFLTQILAASIRGPHHVRACAQLGADVATCPLKVIKDLYKHPLTDLGLAQFLKDHQNSIKNL